MLAAFFEYMRNITYYLVFMAMVGVIVPSGNYKKYVALVMGIILMGVTLGPISAILPGTSVPATEIFGNILPNPLAAQDTYWHNNHFVDVFHSQLTSQTKSLLYRNGYQLVSADWETSENLTYIHGVSLTVRLISEGYASVPFIRVEPVRIAPYQPLEHQEETEETRGVKILISDFYQMSKDNIHVEILKG